VFRVLARRVGEEENFFHLAYAVFYVLCFCFLCFKILGLCFFWGCGGLGFIFGDVGVWGLFFVCFVLCVFCILCVFFGFVFLCVWGVWGVCVTISLYSLCTYQVYPATTFTSLWFLASLCDFGDFGGPKSRAKEHDTDRNLTRYRVGGCDVQISQFVHVCCTLCVLCFLCVYFVCFAFCYPLLCYCVLNRKGVCSVMA